MKIKHFPLIVGISLPLIFIFIISIVIFGPSLFVKPQHNFLYTTEGTYYGYNQGYQNTYKVENQRITLDPIAPRENEIQPQVAPTLYLYNVTTNSSHQITLQEAQGYTIDAGPSSPDGYTVAYEYSHDGIFELFGSNGNDSGYFIFKDNGRKKLNGIVGNQRWDNEGFKLIGWIK